VRDRAGAPDLYYAVFALEGLLALRCELPVAVSRWVEGFGDGKDLDLVHLCALARSRASLALPPLPGLADRIRAAHASDAATLYHAFLVVGALEDLRSEPPDRDALFRLVAALRQPDGSYANEAGFPAGVTPTTAAAVAMLQHLGAPVPPKATDWLLARLHPKGGFVAAPGAPIPDLLSTATALHALVAAGVEIRGIRESTLDFVDTLWTGTAFCGSWEDDAVDAEYTYYALLALGHLGLA
jgi:hypothetical protein